MRSSRALATLTRRTLSFYLPLREKGGSTPQVTVLNPTVTFNASVSMSTVVRSVLVSLTALTSPLRTSACSHAQEGIQGIQRKKCEYIDIDRHIFMHITEASLCILEPLVHHCSHHCSVVICFKRINISDMLLSLPAQCKAPDSASTTFE